MTLSVVCPTRDPGAQVRALLEPLRAVADEIVVAVDSRVDPEGLGEYAAVADRLLRFESGPANSASAWLHEQCRGDWVLTIAGDEVASPALLDALPELIRSREALQYWLPVRWLFPDPRSWLREPPWFPEFHNRLVRNDGTLRFAGLKHTGANPVLPCRYVDAPLYHLNLLLLDSAERREKARRNERERPGLVAPGGTPLNDAYYLPETSARRPPEPVPARDLVEIRGVLDARSLGLRPPEPPPLGTRAEIEALWAGRELAAGAYAVRIEPFEDPPTMAPGEHRAIHVQVLNEGGEWFPWGLDQPPLVRVGHRIAPMDDPAAAHEGPRSPLPCDLRPGERSIVPVVVVAPNAEGDYRLEIDLVHERVRWFGRPLMQPLRVATPPGRG